MAQPQALALTQAQKALVLAQALAPAQAQKALALAQTLALTQRQKLVLAHDAAEDLALVLELSLAQELCLSLQGEVLGLPQ